jgi:hypothetical protein
VKTFYTSVKCSNAPRAFPDIFDATFVISSRIAPGHVRARGEDAISSARVTSKCNSSAKK